MHVMSNFTRTALRTPFFFRTCFQKGYNDLNCRPETQQIVNRLFTDTSFSKCRLLSSATAGGKSQRIRTSNCFVNLFSHSPFRNRKLSTATSRPSSMSSNVMDLKEVMRELDRFAPTSLAESWDNVGLLVEPTPPHRVQTMFLTNDLTEDVLTEAIDKKSDLILSYHPPIFTPLKRLTMANAKERIVVRAIEKRIAVYSPHTCFDAVAGGVNVWLAEGLESCKVEPLKTSHKSSENGWTHKLEYLETNASTVSLTPDLNASAVMKIQTANGFQCAVNCNEQGLVSIMRTIEGIPEIRSTVQITKLEKLPIPGTGIGRICRLEPPASLATLVQRVKNHLGLQHVQLAVGSKKSQESEVQSVAICAGSGASVLSGVPADVYLTGEMSHHDILAAVARGTSVILCNHSNTERGYLRVLKSKLEIMFNGKIEIIVSEVDADPLNVV